MRCKVNTHKADHPENRGIGKGKKLEHSDDFRTFLVDRIRFNGRSCYSLMTAVVGAVDQEIRP